MFRLGRADVLPVDDYGVRKGFGVILHAGELPGKKDVAAYGERWAPYRTVASWYLWRAAERGKLTQPVKIAARPKAAKPPATRPRSVAKKRSKAPGRATRSNRSRSPRARAR